MRGLNTTTINLLGFQLELFKWQQKLRHLYVIIPGGTCVYDHDFTPHEVDQDLVTGALAGVTGIIQEVTKKEGNLKVIEQENAIILLEYGKKLTFALLADEELAVLRNKLELFAQEFENFFEALFPIYKGEGSREITSLGDTLVKKFFEK